MKVVKNYINRMQGESVHKRNRHALAWSVGITGLVLVLWLINLQHTLSSFNQAPVAVAPATENRASVSDTFARMGRGWNRLQASVINSFER